MKKRKQFLLLMGVLLSMQFMFANNALEEYKLQVFKQKLVTEPANRHWILSKVAGWKSAVLIGFAGFVGGVCCLYKCASHYNVYRDFSANKEFYLFMHGEEEYDNLLSFNSDRNRDYAIATTCTFVATIITAVLAGVVTKGIVKRPLYKVFEDYIKNWEEERLNAPKEFIPLLDIVAQEYALSKNKSQYVRSKISEVFEIIFGEKII